MIEKGRGDKEREEIKKERREREKETMNAWG